MITQNQYEQEAEWQPGYYHWRHGGWYTSARYPSGACGCVSNNYEDKKWRMACSHHGLTFSTRRDAANAERAMTLAMCEEAEKTSALLAACRCALADLEGIMPDYEPGGDRTNPAWKTINDLRAAIAKATA